MKESDINIIPNLSLSDVIFFLKEVDHVSIGYRNNDDIGPLYDKIYTKAIWNVLHNSDSNELSKDQQLWIVSRIAEYILTPKDSFSDEYEKIIMSDELDKRINHHEVKITKRYNSIIKFKYSVKEKQKKQKLADDEGETRIAELRTMVDTFISNRTNQNKKSLNKFIQANIEQIFNFLPKEKQTEIEQLIQQANKQSKGGGFSVRSNRKQSKRRLRKTRHRRKKITKKPKQV